jgi:hypothetical protein
MNEKRLTVDCVISGKLNSHQKLDFYTECLLKLMIQKGVIKDEQEYWDFVDSIKVAEKLAEKDQSNDFKTIIGNFQNVETIANNGDVWIDY